MRMPSVLNQIEQTLRKCTQQEKTTDFQQQMSTPKKLKTPFFVKFETNLEKYKANIELIKQSAFQHHVPMTKLCAQNRNGEGQTPENVQKRGIEREVAWFDLPKSSVIRTFSASVERQDDLYDKRVSHQQRSKAVGQYSRSSLSAETTSAHGSVARSKIRENPMGMSFAPTLWMGASNHSNAFAATVATISAPKPLVRWSS